MKYLRKDGIDPKIRRLFPWALFLFLAALFALGALSEARGDDAHPRQAASSWHWTCDDLRAYLSTHTEAEARAEAVARHLPQWLIRKAEKCL